MLIVLAVIPVVLLAGRYPDRRRVLIAHGTVSRDDNLTAGVWFPGTILVPAGYRQRLSQAMSSDVRGSRYRVHLAIGVELDSWITGLEEVR